jgi:hypothetical protein
MPDDEMRRCERSNIYHWGWPPQRGPDPACAAEIWRQRLWKDLGYFPVVAARDGDDVISKSGNGQVVIYPGLDHWHAPTGPFVIGDVHTLFEWAMLLGDLHPGRPLGAVGTSEEGWEHLRTETIDLFDRPRAIFKALAGSGKVKHVRAVWYEEPPIDQTVWRARRTDVLDVVSALGADGEVIRMLLADREQQTHSETAGAASTGSEPTDPSERQDDDAAGGASDDLRPASGRPPISAPTLRKYLQDKKAEGGPIPAADTLFPEVVLRFPEHHVTRGDVRTVHRDVWGPQRPGRRRKNSAK